MDNASQAKRILLWLGLVALIGGAVFGMTRLVANAPTDQTALLTKAVSSSDWVRGDGGGKVVLVEYSDFQCPACRIFYLILEQFDEKYGDKIQLVFRHFPLNYHANAALAAQAAEAAGKQGKFWEMYDVLFESRDTWVSQQVAEAEGTFTAYARLLGLDIEQFKKDLNSEEIKKKIQEDYESGIKSGVDATPTFFLNGKKLPHPRSYEEFEDIIKQAIDANS